jgi:phospholipid/cholesterol/gamma-HCH transport system ATP-binding protein
VAADRIIEVDRLTARYGDATVLQNVSFAVQRGEVFVIIGASGCGKSTLMRHMVGLDRAAAGRIKIDGVDIQQCSDDRFRRTLRNVGVLFQNSALFGSMTLAENVALPILEYTRLPPGAVDQLVRMKLCMVDLSGFEAHLPSEISGGMKKRAGLARAMAMDPDIIFYDEPSAGLDPIVAAGLDALIRKMQSTFKLTSIVVTHEMASVDVIADTVCMLHGGKVVALGTPQEVKATKHAYVTQFFERKPDDGGGDPEQYLNSLTGID